MLVSTSRYADKTTRRFAIFFANVFGSYYCSRGKKTIEKLVSKARKIGENTIALIFQTTGNLQNNKFFFISVSIHGWNWKNDFLYVTNPKIYAKSAKKIEMEICAINGKDTEIFEKLFGIDCTDLSFYHSGNGVLSVENEKFKLTKGNKNILEFDYRIFDLSTTPY